MPFTLVNVGPALKLVTAVLRQGTSRGPIVGATATFTPPAPLHGATLKLRLIGQVPLPAGRYVLVLRGVDTAGVGRIKRKAVVLQ
jgi:hypothetical protein